MKPLARSRSRGWPLRRLLLAAYVGLLGAALVGVSIGIRLLVGRFLDETRIHETQDTCKEAWERLGLPSAQPWVTTTQHGLFVLHGPNLDQLEYLVRDLARPERQVRWRDSRANVIISAGGRPMPLHAGRRSSQVQWWDLAITSPQGLVGTLELGLDRRADRQLLSALGRYLIICSLTILVLAILVCSWLATYWLAPLKTLADTLEKLAQGDLSARPPKARGWLIPTEWGRLRQCADNMATRIEASFSAQRRFIADASHELRTPLTAVAAMAELLDSDELAPKDRARAATTISRESQRMTHLVEDLLTLSRAEEGRPLPSQKCPFLTILTSLSEEFHQTNPNRTIKLEGDPAIAIQAPTTMVRTILRNLMENALRYSDSDITCSVTACEQTISVLVEDLGLGIPPEDLTKVFDRFYRSDHSRCRATGGSGLGLAIVKSLVEKTGGRIELESQLGVGTSVTVTWTKEALTHAHDPRS